VTVTATFAPPTVTSCGALITASLDAAGEVDEFSFDGSAGSIIKITLVETSNFGGPNGSVDARGLLIAPSGAPVGSVFDSNAQVQFTLPETGTYAIQVNASNLVTPGSYDLTVE